MGTPPALESVIETLRADLGDSIRMAGADPDDVMDELRAEIEAAAETIVAGDVAIHEASMRLIKPALNVAEAIAPLDLANEADRHIASELNSSPSLGARRFEKLSPAARKALRQALIGRKLYGRNPEFLDAMAVARAELEGRTKQKPTRISPEDQAQRAAFAAKIKAQNSPGSGEDVGAVLQRYAIGVGAVLRLDRETTLDMTAGEFDDITARVTANSTLMRLAHGQVFTAVAEAAIAVKANGIDVAGLLDQLGGGCALTGRLLASRMGLDRLRMLVDHVAVEGLDEAGEAIRDARYALLSAASKAKEAANA